MDTMTKRITDARFKRSIAGRTTNYADGFRDGHDQALADLLGLMDRPQGIELVCIELGKYRKEATDAKSSD